MNKKYLHLDFKGITPKFDQIFSYFDFFKKCGFTGIVFEFDCRIAWKTWKETNQIRFSWKEAKKMVEYVENLGLEVIPLMQIQGHLEWMLKSEDYAFLRENNTLTLCPTVPQSKILLTNWIDEIRELFPNSQKIHLGGDEVAYMGICEECKKTKKNGMELFIEHATFLCEHAISKNFQPLLWSDMFLNGDNTHFINQLPKQTIIVNWQYWGTTPWEKGRALDKTNFEIWGASAIQCGYYDHFWRVVNNPHDRLDNVIAWNKYDGTIMHTTWGRPGNLWCLYPSWLSFLPIFIAAGSTEKWENHQWYEKLDKLAHIMRRDLPHELMQSLAELDSWEYQNSMEKEYLNWLKLGLEFQILSKNYQEFIFAKAATDATIPYVGKNNEIYNKYFVEMPKKLKERLDIWAEKTQAWFDSNNLNEAEEFIAEKRAIFKL